MEIEPWDEVMQRTLLTALVQNGQRRAAASAQYEAYAADLQAELGISPEAETAQLIQQLQEERPAAAPPAVWHGFPLEQTIFLGRTTEIERLHTALTNAPSLPLEKPSFSTLLHQKKLGF